ncbi:DUF1989 domain-containing protein [Methylorubrum salsuginis]|uniref:Aminomethyltransferase n=1 Tax=Methylorubrum salsuginis TaxID=414703 RepID=A0A1I4JG43_9HYPH|nr:aminomethyltransferase family protein [Methylorubrum salsuginis]SFL65522.1 aminomethyltransferase [Methylorubrum salsuginis]
MNQMWFQPAPASARERAIQVPGGGCCVVAVTAGDVLRIVDPEGLQGALLYARAGTFEPAGEAPFLESLLANGIDGAEVARATLAAGDVAPSDLAGLAVLAGETQAGAVWEGIAAQASLCLVAAPGRAMAPEAQDVPTALRLTIRSTQSTAGQAPPPLAPPLQDIRIDAATARAFTVRAGQFIQIIDVDGRQCADFLAFDAAELAEGREFGLDATTTHTLMGTSSPKPGLHAKYFDARMVPLVEVVQDTVGRHDTFMLACSAKYYEDMGYPGHSNCTDNFNAVLTRHGIASRKGWPAINFFYNTIPGPHDRIDMDEPWSRPGDYVLLRALTDLVCATSSCADDIDPANGWEPTDIHVRVYDAACDFPRGMSHRTMPDSEPRLTRETGFHPATAALTRKFEDYRGFWLPSCFSAAGPIEEYWACRERAVVLDLSALRKFEVTGPDAEALMQRAITRDVRKLAIGQIVYAAMCYEHGGMIDDGTLFRLGENNFRWVCGDAYCGPWLREMAERHGLKVWVRESTDQLHNLSIQGPRARHVLHPILVTPPHQPSISELKWFRFTVGRLAGVPVVVSRTGYTGELGYEVWCHPGQGPAVWRAVMEAGAPHGLVPAGLAALDMLRIEAGLVFAEYEFCDQTDPFEAGIGFAVAAAKSEAYSGQEALARRRAAPQRRLVGLDLIGNEAVGHGDPVYIGRAQVGVITSAARSPVLRKTIALARLDLSAAKIGTAVEIGKLDGHRKRLAASVVPFPHYDPEKTRVRAEPALGTPPPRPTSPTETVETAGMPA